MMRPWRSMATAPTVPPSHRRRAGRRPPAAPPGAGPGFGAAGRSRGRPARTAEGLDPARRSPRRPRRGGRGGRPRGTRGASPMALRTPLTAPTARLERVAFHDGRVALHRTPLRQGRAVAGVQARVVLQRLNREPRSRPAPRRPGGGPPIPARGPAQGLPVRRLVVGVAAGPAVGDERAGTIRVSLRSA